MERPKGKTEYRERELRENNIIEPDIPYTGLKIDNLRSRLENELFWIAIGTYKTNNNTNVIVYLTPKENQVHIEYDEENYVVPYGVFIGTTTD